MFSPKWLPLLFLLSLSAQLLLTAWLVGQVPSVAHTGWPSDLHKAKQVAALLRTELETHYYSLLLFHVCSVLL